jgi:hypothetical protein
LISFGLYANKSAFKHAFMRLFGVFDSHLHLPGGGFKKTPVGLSLHYACFEPNSTQRQEDLSAGAQIIPRGGFGPRIRGFLEFRESPLSFSAATALSR